MRISIIRAISATAELVYGQSRTSLRLAKGIKTPLCDWRLGGKCSVDRATDSGRKHLL